MNEEPPFVVLGEPGMGKTSLLERMSEDPRFTFTRASVFATNPKRFKHSQPDTTLAIDAIDEVAALQEGDPLHNVLRALAEIDYPPFVISCRSADWRGAVGAQEIASHYPKGAIEWTLEPLGEESAIGFLTQKGVEEQIAKNLVQELTEKELDYLYDNPLTLDLLQSMTGSTDLRLPKSRAELFEQAVDFLRLESNERNSDKELARLSKVAALDAAGALMGSLLLTGKDRIAKAAVGIEEVSTLAAADVTDLPGGANAHGILQSRLFKTSNVSDSLFSPLHRTIAEYLGARWLAGRVAENKETTARLLSIFEVDGLVPASLRGLHAWLAREPRLASRVIANDPYGVLRYGDADGLSPEHAEQLLSCLQALQAEDPYFRAGDWATISASSLTSCKMTEPIRSAIRDPKTRFHLRTLLLEIVQETSLASALAGDLEELIKDESLSYAERFEAGAALNSPAQITTNWSKLVRELLTIEDDSSSRLAIELMSLVGTQEFSDDELCEAIIVESNFPSTRAMPKDRTVLGPIYLLERAIPDSRVPVILDGLTRRINEIKEKHDIRYEYWEGRSEFTTSALKLVERALSCAHKEPVRLWRWLQAVEYKSSYDRVSRERIRLFLEANDGVRLTIQRHALLGEYPKDSDRGLYRLTEASSGLRLQRHDIVILLLEIASSGTRDDSYDQIWSDLIAWARDSDGVPEEVQRAARRFTTIRPNLIEKLDSHISPKQQKWEVKQKQWQEKKRKRAQAKEESRQIQQAKYEQHIKDVRDAVLQWTVLPAKLYLNMFSDLPDVESAPDRIGNWLGPKVQAAALEGFERTLTLETLPSALEIARSYAKGKYWHLIHPIIAGLAERWRNRRGFDDLELDVIILGSYGLAGELIDSRADIKGMAAELDHSFAEKGGSLETYWRNWFEPHFEEDTRHIPGLYRFAEDTNLRPVSAKMAVAWLRHYPYLRFENTATLARCAFSAVKSQRDRVWAELRSLIPLRLSRAQELSDDSRLWRSIQFALDVDSFAEWFANMPEPDPNQLWPIRSLIGPYRQHEFGQFRPSARQLALIMQCFRASWPFKVNRGSESVGDVNPWDATEFLKWTANTLAQDTSDEATVYLLEMLSEQDDGYAESIRGALANQRRLKMEAKFLPVSIQQLAALMNNSTPTTAAEVQALVLSSIDELQAKLRGSATDVIKHFYTDNGIPRTENECRDLLINFLRLPFGIQVSPEEAMPNNSRADCGFRLNDIVIPLEAKGQWHRKVWEAPKEQLGRQYLRLFQSEGRGLYLVFWFGRKAPPGKRLKRPPNDLSSPKTPEEMKRILEDLVPKGLRDQIAMYVLDLTESPR